jgi:hypothetical protein
MADNARTPFVDLGRFSAKSIKQLKKGRAGKVTESVDEALATLAERGSVAKDATAVIVVVKEKRKKNALDAIIGKRLF